MLSFNTGAAEVDQNEAVVQSQGVDVTTTELAVSELPVQSHSDRHTNKQKTPKTWARASTIQIVFGEAIELTTQTETRYHIGLNLFIYLSCHILIHRRVHRLEWVQHAKQRCTDLAHPGHILAFKWEFMAAIFTTVNKQLQGRHRAPESRRWWEVLRNKSWPNRDPWLQAA